MAGTQTTFKPSPKELQVMVEALDQYESRSKVKVDVETARTLARLFRHWQAIA